MAALVHGFSSEMLSTWQTKTMIEKICICRGSGSCEAICMLSEDLAFPVSRMIS